MSLPGALREKCARAPPAIPHWLLSKVNGIPCSFAFCAWLIPLTNSCDADCDHLKSPRCERRIAADILARVCDCLWPVKAAPSFCVTFAKVVSIPMAGHSWSSRPDDHTTAPQFELALSTLLRLHREFLSPTSCLLVFRAVRGFLCFWCIWRISSAFRPQ